MLDADSMFELLYDSRNFVGDTVPISLTCLISDNLTVIIYKIDPV